MVKCCIQLIIKIIVFHSLIVIQLVEALAFIGA